MKVDKFINLRKGNMSVEEYSMNLTLLPRYAPSLVSNPRDEMSSSVTGVADLVKEQRRTTMIHNDMNLSILMVYAQSIEESKLSRISRNLKRSGSNEQNKPRLKRGLHI